MSGVRVGTRLEQLEALHQRVGHEIEAERLAMARGERRTPVAVTYKYPHPVTISRDVVMDRLTSRSWAHGPLPAPHIIRAWAIDNGYMAGTHRTGPIPADVVDLYRQQVLS